MPASPLIVQLSEAIGHEVASVQAMRPTYMQPLPSLTDHAFDGHTYMDMCVPLCL